MINIKNMTGGLSVLQRKERRIFFLQLAAESAISILDIVFLAVLVFITGALVQPGPSHGWVSDYLAGVIAIFCLLFWGKNLVAIWLQQKQHAFQYAVALRLSGEQLNRYLDTAFEEYTSVSSSAQIYRISQLPVEFCHYMLRGYQQIAGNFLLAFFAVTALVIYQPTLFLLLLLLLSPAVLITGRVVKRRIVSLKTNTRTASERSLRFLNEALQGFIESRVYRKKDFFMKRYITAQQQLNQYLASQQSIQMLPPRLMEAFAVLAFAMLAILSLVLGDSVSVTTCGAFLAAAYRIIPAVVRIINAAGQVKAYSFTTAMLALPGKRFTVPVPAADTIRSVEFRNVSFHFGSNQIFSDLNFRMNAGELCGISGLSGRGKTTIINMMLGFVSPASGHILINGQPTTAAERQQLMSRISYVKQHPFVMEDSMVTNIAFDETVPDHKLRDVFLTTGVDQIMNTASRAGEKVIRESGRNISGGQRQRIAFARALYKPFDLLLLDEPFSEVDASSVDGFTGQLRNLAGQGKIILMVSHHDQSLGCCDKIIRLEQQ